MNATAPPPRTAHTLVSGNRPTGIVPTDFDGVWRVATVIYNGGMAPKDYLMQPAEDEDAKEAVNRSIARISVALMHGLEIGLPPMQAIQKIAIINGRPCVWGDAVIGLVLASNKSEYIDEHFEGEEGTDTFKAVCITKRKNNTKETKAEFSVKDAKAARLWDARQTVKRFKKGGRETYEVNNDSPWHRFPKRMLQMRARVALRDAYADVLGGLSIAEEFIGGDDAIDVTPAEAQPVKKAPPPPPGVVAGVTMGEAMAQAIKDDGLDIPASLRRSPTMAAGKVIEHEATTGEVKDPNAFDEDEWLNGLGNAYDGCEDLADLNENMLNLAEPKMEIVSNEAWERAKMLYEEAVNRINAQ